MSDIEWSPWVKGAHLEAMPDGTNMQNDGTGNYRIPMSDYKRITGMPEWSEAPEWAMYLCQDADGQWKFTDTIPRHEHSLGGSFWVGETHKQAGLPGTVLGDWRETLQERPCEASMTVEAKDFRLGENDQWAKHFMSERAGDPLDSHPNSEPDADQYSVGADTVDDCDYRLPLQYEPEEEHASEARVFIRDQCLEIMSDGSTVVVTKEEIDSVLGMGADTIDDSDDQPPRSKYHREIASGVWVDVYDVLKAWSVTNPALQHLIKKALAPGERGHKTLEQDMEDIVASAKRARELA